MKNNSYFLLFCLFLVVVRVQNKVKVVVRVQNKVQNNIDDYLIPAVNIPIQIISLCEACSDTKNENNLECSVSNSSEIGPGIGNKKTQPRLTFVM